MEAQQIHARVGHYPNEVFNDKQTITADPTDADLVYAVWDRLVFPPSERASVISGS